MYRLTERQELLSKKIEIALRCHHLEVDHPLGIRLTRYSFCFRLCLSFDSLLAGILRRTQNLVCLLHISQRKRLHRLIIII